MMPRLKKRGEFVRAANSGVHASTTGIVLQAFKRDEPDSGRPARIGFTTSKKVGKAVQRNRARRRLRTLAEAILAPVARSGFDYVLVGRTSTVNREFLDLADDLRRAIELVHSGRSRSKRPRRTHSASATTSP
jgi:ribonuclease P protein component